MDCTRPSGRSLPSIRQGSLIEVTWTLGKIVVKHAKPDDELAFGNVSGVRNLSAEL
jgi:hypothetical protein